jgi:hypothetical protein
MQGDSFGHSHSTHSISSVLSWPEILFSREDSRLVRHAALKHHSAHHGLGSKIVEQELTEGTEILRYLCYLLFYEFGCGYAALSPSLQIRLCVRF